VATDDSPVSGLLAALPALAAMAVASGAGIYAIAHTVALPAFSAQLWALWLVGLLACAVNCYGTMRQMQLPARDPRRRGWKWWQRCMWVAAFILALLPPLSAAIGATIMVPADVTSENNLLVAVLMGWCMLACLLVTGALMGPPLGPSRPVPLAVLLLPELSLFGLLNIVSVDTPVMMSFLVYVAAALYLLSYEIYLTRRPFSRQRASSVFAAPRANPTLKQQVRTAAMHYLLACSVWLAIFTAGAGLFYGPLSVLLPWSLAVDFVRSRQPQREETRDWRDATRVMELRGGANPVSERPVLRVLLREGEAKPMWRGRVYERYSRGEGGVSRWEVFLRPGQETYDLLSSTPGTWTDLKPKKTAVEAGLQRALPPLSSDLGNRRDVVEQFYLLESFIGGPAIPVFASGEPVAVRSGYQSVALRTDGTARLSDPIRNVRVFSVRSQLIEPNLSALGSAPGLDEEQIRQWKRDNFTAPTIELPRDANGQRLRAIANAILQEARQEGRPARTPYQKASAIGRYLITNYEYSLASPAVPPGEDSVLFFLTESRLGACDMFASSMALLLRAMDVPTRVASGFLQPEAPKSWTDEPFWCASAMPMRGSNTTSRKWAGSVSTPLKARAWPPTHWAIRSCSFCTCHSGRTSRAFCCCRHWAYCCW
jgi:hypothetical protein